MAIQPLFLGRLIPTLLLAEGPGFGLRAPGAWMFKVEMVELVNITMPLLAQLHAQVDSIVGTPAAAVLVLVVSRQHQRCALVRPIHQLNKEELKTFPVTVELVATVGRVVITPLLDCITAAAAAAAALDHHRYQLELVVMVVLVVAVLEQNWVL